MLSEGPSSMALNAIMAAWRLPATSELIVLLMKGMKLLSTGSPTASQMSSKHLYELSCAFSSL